MKSFCVLNSPLNEAIGVSLGKAVNVVFGKKTGVLVEESLSAEYLAKGIALGGGCAAVFNGCFEAQVSFIGRHYALDGMLFVGGEKGGTVSAYSADARAAEQSELDELSRLTLENSLPDETGGIVADINADGAYYKHLLLCSESFENVRVNIGCANAKPSVFLKRALLALGGSVGGKVLFSLSGSGLTLSAVDETGAVYSHSQLSDACAACEIESGYRPKLGFMASSSLDDAAKQKGFVPERSFAGGDELWQRDAVFLTARLMHHMSVYGCGLHALCAKTKHSAVKRKSVSSSLLLSDIADVIDCEELMTDCNGSVFARLSQGNLLVTSCSYKGKYCIEVQAENSETAEEIIGGVVRALA